MKGYKFLKEVTRLLALMDINSLNNKYFDNKDELESLCEKYVEETEQNRLLVLELNQELGKLNDTILHLQENKRSIS